MQSKNNSSINKYFPNRFIPENLGQGSLLGLRGSLAVMFLKEVDILSIFPNQINDVVNLAYKLADALVTKLEEKNEIKSNELTIKELAEFNAKLKNIEFSMMQNE